jgi:hypothetical protein
MGSPSMLVTNVFHRAVRVRLRLIVVAALLFAIAGPIPAEEQPGDRAQREFFESRVQPILERRCFGCHSHATGEMKGGLTLDSRSGWTEGGDSGPTLVPGEPDKSLLIKAVERKGLAMPPKEALPAEEVAMLREWVQNGAFDPRVLDPKTTRAPSAEGWWAVQPLAKPPVPKSGTVTAPETETAIDAFLRQKLLEQGLDFAAPADRRAWIRRLTFDLHGLPPTPEEVEAYVADADPKADENLVERLLASPRYGERFARLWLDVAHFGDSNGFGMDRPRPTAWPYRDYVIERFNADVPYARFVREQIAADVLYPDETERVPALGFLAAGPFNQSALVEQVDGTLCKKIALNLDRDDFVTTVATTFLSVTLHCARCHDHKFDPLTQEDYYGLQAVFSGIIRGERTYGPVEQSRMVRQWRETREKLAAGTDLASLPDEHRTLVAREVEAVLSRLREAEARWVVPEGIVTTESPDGLPERLADGSWRFSTKGEKDVYEFAFVNPPARIAAVRVEVLADDKLPHKGPGLQPQNGNLTLSEFRLLTSPGDKSTEPVAVKVKSARADFNQTDWGIDKALDGKSETGWGIHPEEGRSHQAVFELDAPLVVAPGSKVVVRLEQNYGRQHNIGRARVSFAAEAPSADPLASPDVVRALTGDGAAVAVPAIAVPATAVPATAAALGADGFRRLAVSVVDGELAKLPKLPVVFAVGGDAKGVRNYQPPAQPRPIHKLVRGDVTRPGPEMVPGGMSAMPVAFSVPEQSRGDEGARRAAFAMWLTDDRNPLLWRSIANRVWGWHFGTGLVDTPSDFGRMGSTPTHPELLDHLACELRDAGGSLKSLHRAIVLSRAYRQSTTASAKSVERDGDNRLLARFPRRRLDAEQLRDGLLAASGRIDLTMGGPSAMQFDFQDPNEGVSPLVDYGKFDVDSPAARRRGVYRFVFRNVGDPFLDAFDAPDPSLSVARRTVTITPFQALSLYNNAFVLRQCEWLARRLDRDGASVERQLDDACRLLFARPAEADELETLAEYAGRHGLENTLRVLVNSNEFLFLP